MSTPPHLNLDHDHPTILTNMSQTLLSILCGEDFWCWDANNNSMITFNQNATGEVSPFRVRGRGDVAQRPEVTCRQELNIWIAAEFAWKPQRHASLDQVVDISGVDGTRKDPHLIRQFHIEMTLAKRRIARMRQLETQGWMTNESVLTNEAYRPKMYTVRLKKGNILAPFDAMGPWEDQYTPRFAFRLAFDPSP